MLTEPDYWSPRTLRAYVLERDGHQCTQCGKPGPRLHLHHTSYRAGVRNEVDSNDRPEWLTTICGSCHGKHHHAENRANPTSYVCQCGEVRLSPSPSHQIKCQKCGQIMERQEVELGTCPRSG
jgi:hypothetical protein